MNDSLTVSDVVDRLESALWLLDAEAEYGTVEGEDYTVYSDRVTFADANEFPVLAAMAGLEEIADMYRIGAHGPLK